MFIAKHKESINNKHFICMVLMVIELFLRCPRIENTKGLVQLGLLNPNWLYIWCSKQKSMKTFSVKFPTGINESSKFRLLLALKLLLC